MHVLAQKTMRSYMRAIFGTMVTIHTILIIAMAVTSSQGDDGIYNITATVYVFCVFMIEFINAIIVFHFGQQLKRRLRESFTAKNDDTEKLFLHLIKKVYAFQSGAISRPIGQLPLVLGGIFFLTVGNASFFWIIYGMILILQGPSLAQVTLGIFQNYGQFKEGSDLSDRRSRHSKMVVSATEMTTATLSPVNGAIA
jgi:hypothetical protein